jgi:hypothetical protein
MTAWPNDPFTVWGEGGPLHSTTPMSDGRRRCSACGQTVAADAPPMVAPCPGPCGACTLPYADRHHDPDYIMHRTPYDIPRHTFTRSY